MTQKAPSLVLSLPQCLQNTTSLQKDHDLSHCAYYSLKEEKRYRGWPAKQEDAEVMDRSVTEALSRAPVCCGGRLQASVARQALSGYDGYASPFSLCALSRPRRGALLPFPLSLKERGAATPRRRSRISERGRGGMMSPEACVHGRGGGSGGNERAGRAVAPALVILAGRGEGKASGDESVGRASSLRRGALRPREHRGTKPLGT